MAALAYLLPPVTGLLAFALGRDARVRWHGLQSVLFGALWPTLIYLASLLGPTGTRLAAVLGAVLWAGLLVTTFTGIDPRLPGSRVLKSWAEASMADR
jgi:uncharacterized membrane protein